jgi:hypothetical protein
MSNFEHPGVPFLTDRPKPDLLRYPLAAQTNTEDTIMPGNGKPRLHPTQSLLPRGRILLVDEDEKDLK